MKPNSEITIYGSFQACFTGAPSETNMYAISTKISDSHCALRWAIASLNVFVCLTFLSASSISKEQFSTAIRFLYFR